MSHLFDRWWPIYSSFRRNNDNTSVYTYRNTTIVHNRPSSIEDWSLWLTKLRPEPVVYKVGWCHEDGWIKSSSRGATKEIHGQAMLKKSTRFIQLRWVVWHWPLVSVWCSRGVLGFLSFWVLFMHGDRSRVVHLRRDWRLESSPPSLPAMTWPSSNSSEGIRIRD